MVIPWLDPDAPYRLHVLIFCHLALIGAASGSFAGVLVSRIPKLQSIVLPPSYCDGCGRRLQIFENIPILGFVLSWGRCRTCKSPIGLRTLVLEVLCATTFVALGAKLDSPFELLVWLIATTLLLALTYIDLDYFWLPDRLVLALYVLGLFGAMLPTRLGVVSALFGLLPAAGLWLFAWSYERIFAKEGLGFGDIKLLGALGLIVGAKHALALLTLACIEGAIVGSLMLWLRPSRAAPSSLPKALEGDDWQPDAHAVPFGPFLALASLQTILCPQMIERAHVLLVQVAASLAQRLF